MSYQTRYDKKSIEFLCTLQQKQKKRIFEKIESTKENPYIYFTRLKARTDFKLRVGDYRILADIQDNHKLILVRHIGHKKKHLFKIANFHN